MTKLIPLDFGFLAETRPYDAIRALTLPFESIPVSIKRIVQSRDAYCCRFCGFRSLKYQMVVALSGNPWDADQVVTACIFCHQVVCLDLVPAMHSGVLVWLPEVPQARLHHIARQIYTWRITQETRADRARRVLDRLMERREAVRQHAGVEDLLDFAQKLRSFHRGEPNPDFASSLAGLRLFPTDRRLIREEELEYNQFPQILAFWRSKNGPLSSGISYPGVADIEPILLDASELGETSAEPAAEGAQLEQGSKHYVLAARLLQSAAAFFRSLAGESSEIAGDMLRKAEVFDEAAYLVTGDPIHKRNVALGASLLDEAADFFRTIGESDTSSREQMMENWKVFKQTARLLSDDPMDSLR